MRQVKQINIKNRSYYFFWRYGWYKKFLLKPTNNKQKSYKEIDVYKIGYIVIKKFSDCENIQGVNPLYLIIHSARAYFKEKNGENYLILDSTDKYEEVFSGIRSKMKTLNGGKELFYEINHARIGINTDNNLPLNEPLKFLVLRIIIRCVFQKGEKLYPQIYLDECLYEL